MSEHTHAYAGSCTVCGSLVAATVDDPAHQKENAKAIARWMRDGLRIERVTVEHVRVNLAYCACKPRRKMAKQTEMTL